jgi:hypothetical protein
MTGSEPGAAAAFSALVAGLAATAAGVLRQVGALIEGKPAEGAPAPDEAGAEGGGAARRAEALRTGLASARQYIDILIALQEKTKGNLTQDEERLLSSLLADLKISFVKLNDRWTSTKSG